MCLLMWKDLKKWTHPEKYLSDILKCSKSIYRYMYIFLIDNIENPPFAKSILPKIIPNIKTHSVLRSIEKIFGMYRSSSDPPPVQRVQSDPLRPPTFYDQPTVCTVDMYWFAAGLPLCLSSRPMRNLAYYFSDWKQTGPSSCNEGLPEYYEYIEITYDIHIYMPKSWKKPDFTLI
jgi:hypothetical protein